MEIDQIINDLSNIITSLCTTHKKLNLIIDVHDQKIAFVKENNIIVNLRNSNDSTNGVNIIKFIVHVSNTFEKSIYKLQTNHYIKYNVEDMFTENKKLSVVVSFKVLNNYKNHLTMDYMKDIVINEIIKYLKPIDIINLNTACENLLAIEDRMLSNGRLEKNNVFKKLCSEYVSYYEFIIGYAGISWIEVYINIMTENKIHFLNDLFRLKRISTQVFELIIKNNIIIDDWRDFLSSIIRIERHMKTLQDYENKNSLEAYFKGKQDDITVCGIVFLQKS